MRTKIVMYAVLASAGIVGLTQLPIQETQAEATFAAVDPDVLTLMAGRSPGGRGAGALTNTKSRERVHVAPLRGIERVLSGTRVRPHSGVIVADTGQPFYQVGEPLLAVDDTVTGGEAGTGPGGGGFYPIGGVPVSGLIPGGGMGGGGGITPGTNPTPPTGAVPEPSTWLLMLAGMALVGATLRRRRSQPAL